DPREIELVAGDEDRVHVLEIGAGEGTRQRHELGGFEAIELDADRRTERRRQVEADPRGHGRVGRALREAGTARGIVDLDERGIDRTRLVPQGSVDLTDGRRGTREELEVLRGEGGAVLPEELAEVQITEASDGRRDRPRDEANGRSGGAEGIVHVEP